MILKWFLITNLQDFIDLELVSKEYTLNLEGYGERTVMLCKGVGHVLVFDGTTLPINLNDKNPFSIDNYLVYLDSEDDIWLGLVSED